MQQTGWLDQREFLVAAAGEVLDRASRHAGDLRAALAHRSPADAERASELVAQRRLVEIAGGPAVRVEAAGIALFTRIASDDPTALIGLPLIRLTDMLRAEGVSIFNVS